MIQKPMKCWRDRTDCEPLHAIEAFPEMATLSEDEFFEGLDCGKIQPQSFVCAGCIAEEERSLPQDAYRVCWKNQHVDEIGEYDEQDLTHTIAVVSQALAIINTRRVNGGTIDVATMQAGGA